MFVANVCGLSSVPTESLYDSSTGKQEDTQVLQVLTGITGALSQEKHQNVRVLLVPGVWKRIAYKRDFQGSAPTDEFR